MQLFISIAVPYSYILYILYLIFFFLDVNIIKERSITNFNRCCKTMFITHIFEIIKWEDYISLIITDTYTITGHLYNYSNCYWHFILSKRNHYKLVQGINSDRCRAADVKTIVSLSRGNLVNHGIKYIFVPRVVVCRDRSTTISQSHIRFTLSNEWTRR